MTYAALAPNLKGFEAALAAGQPYDSMLEVRKSRQTARAAFRLYYGGYRARDGAVVLGALTKANRDGMRQVLGFPEEDSDSPDYDALLPESVERAHEWKRRFRARFLERTAAEWVRDFDKVGVPASAVRMPEVMAEDPQVTAEQIMWDAEHAVTGAQRVVGPAVLMSKTPTTVQRSAPALGEHSAEVLVESGFSAPEVAALVESGVVLQR